MGLALGLVAAIATAQDSGEGPKRGWTIPPGAAQEANPIAVSPEVLAKGKKLYEDNCQKCHGKGGKQRVVPVTDTVDDGEIRAAMTAAVAG